MARDLLYGTGWSGAKEVAEFDMTSGKETLKLNIGPLEYNIGVRTDKFAREPSIWERIMNVFGWSLEDSSAADDGTKQGSDMEQSADISSADDEVQDEAKGAESSSDDAASEVDFSPITGAQSGNCTIKLGRLMLVNPNFAVETEFIAGRRGDWGERPSYRFDLRSHRSGVWQ